MVMKRELQEIISHSKRRFLGGRSLDYFLEILLIVKTGLRQGSFLSALSHFLLIEIRIEENIEKLAGNEERQGKGMMRRKEVGP